MDNAKGSETRPAKPVPSLVLATQLVEQAARLSEGRWVLALYRDACEASGSFRPSIPWSAGGGRRGESEDPERSRAEAARRAGTRLRRYGVANRLDRLGTLTYRGEGVFEHGQLRGDLARFFRNLRELVGQSFPYAWVPEWHPGGHGLHAHFSLGRFVKVSLIEEAWGCGIVHIKRLGNLPASQGAVGDARAAARYLAKYVRKGMDERRDFGGHRFDVAQGYQPRAERIVGRSDAEVVEEAAARMGGWPSYLWCSREAEEWFGPFAVFCSW